MFELKLEKQVKELKPYALKLTQNTADTEDLIQETLLKALTNQSKFKQGTNLKAWLYTIMRNIFINDYRKKVRKPVIADTTEGQFLLNSSKVVSNTAEKTMAKDAIMMNIRKLNISYRIPFMLYYKGYKYDEIAHKMKLPVGTVKSRIFFARKQLKEVLKEFRAN